MTRVLTSFTVKRAAMSKALEEASESFQRNSLTSSHLTFLQIGLRLKVGNASPVVLLKLPIRRIKVTVTLT